MNQKTLNFLNEQNESLSQHEEKISNVGKEIIKFLDLKPIKSGEQKGRYNTAWGSKTELGLARSIMRIISENS